MPRMPPRAALAILAIAACGDGVEIADAGMGSDGALRGIVSVRVEGRDEARDPVYFQTASGSIVLVTRTNGAGEANALMPAGGFVSVVDENTATVYTWTGVQPGDELALDLSFEQFGQEFPNVSVRIDPLEGANSYYVHSRCETSRNLPDAIDASVAPFFQPCGSTTDLLLVAWGNLGPLGYRYRQNANLLSGATIDLRGEYLPFTATVELLGPTDRSILVRQQPTNLTYTSGREALLDTGREVLSMPTPLVVGTTVYSVASTYNEFTFPKEDDHRSDIATIAWGPASAATTLDLTSPAVAEITSEPELDRLTNTVRWTQAEGARGDAVWANLRAGSYRWIVIGPHTGETALPLPVLPREDLRPNETVFFEDFAVITTEGGYDRVRPYLLGHWIPSEFSRWPMKEASGRVSYRSWF